MQIDAIPFGQASSFGNWTRKRVPYGPIAKHLELGKALIESLTLWAPAGTVDFFNNTYDLLLDKGAINRFELDILKYRRSMTMTASTFKTRACSSLRAARSKPRRVYNKIVEREKEFVIRARLGPQPHQRRRDHADAVRRSDPPAAVAAARLCSQASLLRGSGVQGGVRSGMRKRPTVPCHRQPE
jgi:hypothetical protein